MLFSSKKIIGLDIGTSSIKIAELDVQKKKANLLSFGVAATPAGALTSRGEVNDPQALANVVQSLVKQIGTKRTQAATGVWGSSVMVKKISVPRMEDHLLSEQIRFEAEQYIPFDINEVNLDFARINTKGAAENMDILLVAAQKEFIFKIAEVVESANLQCIVLDVSGFALANCYQFNYGTTPGEVVALLNFGAGVTNFVVVDNGDVVFSRDIPVGGLTFTTEIQKHLGVSLAEAEGLKISASHGQAAQEVNDVVKSTSEAVVEELHRSFDFYSATATESPIQRVMVTGGAMHTTGLLETFQSVLSLPTEKLNPFQTVSANSRIMSPEYLAQHLLHPSLWAWDLER